MKLYVVRHAHAGSRSAWSGDDDRLRPLSPKGHRQAAALADTLTGAGIGRLLSSPSLRCVETLIPLADQEGLAVEEDQRLAEGSDGAAALSLAEELRRADHDAALLCSHGDVIPELLTQLKVAGTVFHDPLTWPKGSVWVVQSNGTHWAEARYLTRS